MSLKLISKRVKHYIVGDLRFFKTLFPNSTTSFKKVHTSFPSIPAGPRSPGSPSDPGAPGFPGRPESPCFPWKYNESSCDLFQSLRGKLWYICKSEFWEREREREREREIWSPTGSPSFPGGHWMEHLDPPRCCWRIGNVTGDQRNINVCYG